MIKAERILLLGFAGVGDTLLSTPAIGVLREGFPNSYIAALVISDGSRTVLARNPHINDILFAEGIWKKPALFIKTVWKLRRSNFDTTLTFYPSSRMLYSLLSFLSRARKRVVHEYKRDSVRKLSFLQNVRVPLVDGGHSVVQNMRLLEPLGVSFEGRSLELLFNVSDGDRRFAVDMLRRFGVSSDDFVVGVHAGSGGMEYKRWPLENFICLAEKIVSEFGWKFIFFCGPQEKEVIEAVNELGNKSILFFEGSRTDTASLSGNGGLFISNDSGLMHVAVSQGIPVIAIFGPTDPKKTDPYTDKKLIVKSKLPCSPCYLPAAHRKFRCIYGHSKCLEEISVEGVLLAIESFLRNRF